MNLDRGARAVVERLHAAGYQVLLAGGCVRDALMGMPPRDWDIVTDAAPEQVQTLFERTIPVGVRFGIVVVISHGNPYEVARFRGDDVYVDGRRPARIVDADPEQDARRRDFTINGMFMDPLTGRVIDYVGGRQDLRARLIRAIGDPPTRFAEDRLRLLRAVRFASSLGFDIDADTWNALQRQAEGIVQISAERIRDELTRILTSPGSARGMQLLLDSGMLSRILPESVELCGLAQPPEFHPEGDTWTHTLQVLRFLRHPDTLLGWAGLLHDIGKARTRTFDRRIRFHGHEKVGADMGQTILRRLRLSNDAVASVSWLVKAHMRLREAPRMRPGRLKRLLREPLFDGLLELHRADCLGSHGDLSLYDFCRRHLAALEPADRRPPRLLTGHDLRRLGFEPGPLFRNIMEALEEEQLEGRVCTARQAEEFVRRRFASALPAADDPV